MKKAIFPGTFDPFTIGHLSIVERGLSLVDEIVVAIGINPNKTTFFSLEQRESMISKLFEHNPRVTVKSYTGLTVDFAKEVSAQFILRGIRSINDFENEKNTADVNRQIGGVETFVLFTEPAYSHISSSIVRELLSHGRQVNGFVPANMLNDKA